MKKSKILDDQVVAPRKRSVIDCSQDGKTIQSEGQLTNIKNIVANLTQGAQPVHVNRAQPQFGDFYDCDDLFTTLNRANTVKMEFNSLPAEIRAAAENDPIKYLEMIQSDEGFEILRNAGLSEQTAEAAELAETEESAAPPTQERASSTLEQS